MDEQNEKLEAGDIVVQNKFTRWFENFWYHYKWHTIFISFFVFVFAVCFVQCATTERSDAIVVYAGGYTLSASEAEEIAKAMTGVMPANEDGSGNSTGLNPFSIYTEKELTAMYRYTDEDTGEEKMDSYAYSSAKAVNQDHISSFSDFLMTGTSSVWLVSEAVYDTAEEDLAREIEPDGLSLIQKERLVPLAELGVSADLAYDAYAVRLADTAFYQYYEVMQLLPEDTLLVFSRSMVVGAVADEEIYEMHRQLFLGIVNFQPK